MNFPSNDFDETRVSLERLRTFLETLVVRGLRACGSDELDKLAMYEHDLEQSGAAGAASALADLRKKIDGGARDAAPSLLHAQTTVRMLEQLLTLQVAQARYQAASAGGDVIDDDEQDEDEAEDDE